MARPGKEGRRWRHVDLESSFIEVLPAFHLLPFRGGPTGRFDLTPASRLACSTRLGPRTPASGRREVLPVSSTQDARGVSSHGSEGEVFHEDNPATVPQDRGGCGVAAMTPWQRAYAFYQSPGTAINCQNWPGIANTPQPARRGPGWNPVALPDGVSAAPARRTIPQGHGIHQIGCTHRSADQLWGYSPSLALGEGAFHAASWRHRRRAEGAADPDDVRNMLPPDRMLPVDPASRCSAGFLRRSQFGGDGLNAVSTHLHGGFVPWVSDGGPMAWFTPNGASAGTKLHAAFMKREPRAPARTRASTSIRTSRARG